MDIICAPKDHPVHKSDSTKFKVVLYDQAQKANVGSTGAKIVAKFNEQRLNPSIRAWDLLSIALSINAADRTVERSKSPDGWTREINLEISVVEPDFWNTKSALLERLLKFLSTDIWQLKFISGGYTPEKVEMFVPDKKSVLLFSGGLDSFIGALDLEYQKMSCIRVGQLENQIAKTQRYLSSEIGDTVDYLQLNHTYKIKERKVPESSQRARSILFLTYGVLTATTLQNYRRGSSIDLYTCENGFISVNPPLTELRIGSLSTRTTHPIFISLFQQLLEDAELRVVIRNPYQFKTKGKMLKECKNQRALKNNASHTTSCGKYGRIRVHCGKCLPCLIRRSAYHEWGELDKTNYKYTALSKNTMSPKEYNDIFSAAIGIVKFNNNGVDSLIGPTLSTVYIEDTKPYHDVVKKGFEELEKYLVHMSVL